MTRLSRLFARHDYLRELLLHLRLWWRLLRDPRVPDLLKLGVPVLALVYLIWPADFLMDLLPVVGQVDDVLVLLLAFRLFESWAPRAVVAEHLQRLRRGSAAPETPKDDGDVIEGEYRVL